MVEYVIHIWFLWHMCRLGGSLPELAAASLVDAAEPEVKQHWVAVMSAVAALLAAAGWFDVLCSYVTIGQRSIHWRTAGTQPAHGRGYGQDVVGSC